MTYAYQVKIDPKLTFENAVRQLTKAVKNPVHVGPIKAETEDWEGDIISGLNNFKIATGNFYVHRDEYADYMNRAEYRQRYPDYYSGNLAEKSLEHFIGCKLLDLASDDLLLDVASENSPVGEIYERLAGCRAFSQDIMYPPGVHGNKIGSDICSIPVPDNYFDKALATCSIEHFEGDTDSCFMREMQRVLKPGGKMIIVPLYIHTRPCAMTDPKYAVAGNVRFDDGAPVYCMEGWGNRHSRFYSPQTLFDRLADGNSLMRFRAHLLKNPLEIDPSIYCRFILTAVKRCGEGA